MYTETDPRTLGVLERALGSASKATRQRAVAMLAHVDCPSREHWLEVAEQDRDVAVCQMACIVGAWVCEAGDPPWPAREEVPFDGSIEESVLGDGEIVFAAGNPHNWEYVVEVWRSDGLPVGVFLCVTCSEDDVHAKCIALGQAVLASASSGAERFEPSEAAAFIVGKRRVPRSSGTLGRGRPPGP